MQSFLETSRWYLHAVMERGFCLEQRLFELGVITLKNLYPQNTASLDCRIQPLLLGKYEYSTLRVALNGSQ
jgi:hypothetical protein